ncbi:MAG: nitroreductase family protein [Clostridia bacterium]|nr:nitroreductase family protein [Clostridia bacterium]
MDFKELSKARYSVRSFSDKKVEQEKLDQILQAANAAPTACNNQPQRLYVVNSAEGIAKLSAITKFTFGASTIIIFTSKKSEEWQNPFTDDYNTGDIDVSIVCTHAMMQAWELGIGSCWVGYFDPAKVRSAFAIPEDEKIIALLPLGYPAEGCKPSRLHSTRKNLQDTVKYL